MSVDRILCLANSYKHDHRCVAGISLVTKQWVRLLGTRVAGCLTVEQTCYPDGSETALLDVFEAELGEKCGSNCHPEDVFIAEQSWRPVRRFDQPRDKHFLESYISKRPVLLEGFGDRVYIRKFAETPASHSLELVRPDDLWWWIREENGKRRNRALFRLGHVGRARYDLAVTDPRWLERLRPLPAGIYPHSGFFGGKPPATLLTVSLSEPFENFHYKLVAGVVNLPA
jgi:hypothetical protein